MCMILTEIWKCLARGGFLGKEEVQQAQEEVVEGGREGKEDWQLMEEEERKVEREM